MTRARQLWGWFVAGGLLFGATAWWGQIQESAEPIYRGVPLRAWLRDLDSGSLHTRQEAAAALEAMGEKAVPSLRRLLRHHDSQLRLRLLGLAQRQSFWRFDDTPDSVWHGRALRACRVLGPRAAPAIPVLIEYLDDADLRHDAAAALADVQPDLFPLTRSITNTALPGAVRRQIAWRLGASHYEGSRAALGALQIAQQDPHPEVRREATASLQRHRRRSEPRP